jgi:hypothetical protein
VATAEEMWVRRSLAKGKAHPEALSLGFSKSRSNTLFSLQGPAGPAGPIGPAGARGPAVSVPCPPHALGTLTQR